MQSAETAYSVAYPDQGYTCSWNELGPPAVGHLPSSQAADLIDESLVKAKKNGYSYELKECNEQLPRASYTVAAEPEVEGTTGILFFCANESGAMHYINVAWASGCITKGVPLLEKANPNASDDYLVATSSGSATSSSK